MRKLILTLTLLGFFAGSAWAAVVEGVIVDTYDGGQSLKVARIDELTKDKVNLNITVDPQTKITGADSISALKAGDAVSIVGTEIEANHFSAQQITVVTKGEKG